MHPDSRDHFISSQAKNPVTVNCQSQSFLQVQKNYTDEAFHCDLLLKNINSTTDYVRILQIDFMSIHYGPNQ